MTALEFCDRILTLALRFRFKVTSWGRSQTQNAAVGGLGDSFHLDFRAIDVELVNIEHKEAFTRRAVQMGLEVTDEGDHLHLEPKT